MAVVFDLKSVKVGESGGNKVITRVYGVTLSGSYSDTAVKGEPIDFTSQTIFTNTKHIPRAGFSRIPTEYGVLNQPIGYLMKIEPGTLLTNWGLRVSDLAAELSNGAYAAGLYNQSGLQVFFSEKLV